MMRDTLLIAVAGLLVAIATACSKSENGAGKGTVAATDSDNRVPIVVTENGFEPAVVTVSKGKEVTFVFERKVERTCATEVVFHLDDGQTIEKDLPLNQPVEVALTFAEAGDVTYSCAMNMIKGSVHVQ